MYHLKRLSVTVAILACFLLDAQGADKYTDQNRPYEFGFNVEIDGSKQQHRHEKKDKDGLIMGEFGFVTADDVYHVTVYATDKDGKFKILSMKNIHLKSSPAPSSRPSSPRQGHALALPPEPATPPVAVPQSIPPPAPQTPFKPVVLQPPGRSCSSCSIPTTTPPAPQGPTASQGVPSNNFVPQNQPQFSAAAPQNPFNQPLSPPVNQPAYPQQELIAPAVAQNYPTPNAPNNYANPESPAPNNYPIPGTPALQQPGSYPNVPTQGTFPVSSNPSAPNNFPQNVRTSKQYTGPEPQFSPSPSGNPAKPTLVSAQMQIVDKNTDINALKPGETRGLPKGLTENDMTDLLYTFNYTVGFHGHFEEGYRNGAKKGYYFVTGRNGVRTRIDYTADDTGFHPRISQEVLDLLSDDVPMPETEKDEKYGLKGYEFKWLYYPVGS